MAAAKASVMRHQRTSTQSRYDPTIHLDLIQPRRHQGGPPSRNPATDELAGPPAGELQAIVAMATAERGGVSQSKNIFLLTVRAFISAVASG
jgi:hypothetical protein